MLCELFFLQLTFPQSLLSQAEGFLFLSTSSFSKHLVDFLTTSRVLCAESPPKLSLLVTEPPDFCQPSSATFDTHKPNPCHFGATHNEIVRVTWIQIPSLTHTTSVALNLSEPQFSSYKMGLLRCLRHR